MMPLPTGQVVALLAMIDSLFIYNPIQINLLILNIHLNPQSLFFQSSLIVGISSFLFSGDLIMRGVLLFSFLSCLGLFFLEEVFF